MEVTKVSKLTGNIHTLDIPVTPAQIASWNNGAFIQDAMPNLTPDEREFLMTGVTPEEWEEAFGE